MTWLDYWPIALAVIQAALAWVIWSMRRSFASVEALNALDKRLTHVEGQLAAQPSQEAVHELSLAIERLTGDLKRGAERMDGMQQLIERQEAVTARLEDYVRELSRSKA